MKNILVLISLVYSTIASAATYYVSSAGDDSATGLSESAPWKTIERVNIAFLSMKPGDRILFRRGDIFYGTVLIAASGASGNPIVISSYGDGKDPVISGFTSLSTWNDEGNGIYSKVIPSESNPNFILIDGKWYSMGRYPNNAYLSY